MYSHGIEPATDNLTPGKTNVHAQNRTRDLLKRASISGNGSFRVPSRELPAATDALGGSQAWHSRLVHNTRVKNASELRVLYVWLARVTAYNGVFI